MTRHRMDYAPHLPQGTGKKFSLPNSDGNREQHVHSNYAAGSAGVEGPQR
jgi:hypothetical protein